ncbi:MAG: transglycosylase SLT domain-containing protein [Bacteroidota bacterium]
MQKPNQPIALTVPRIRLRHWGTIALIVVGSNMATHFLMNPATASIHSITHVEARASKRLYLDEKAGQVIFDMDGFREKVRETARKLGIPSAWLMAVIDQESQFQSSVANFKGSGAVGLIQFMPGTAAELGTSSQHLQMMDAPSQMEYVYKYLAQVRNRYGDYESLTDLYLGILYPKARKQDPCYTLFSSPSTSYRQNSGLDHDRDRRVTISDIDRRLRDRYPEAYITQQ